MAKRFTSTEKWDDPWFQDLPPRYKCFWLYLLDKCDCAGIWNVNLRAAEFFIGEKIEIDEIENIFKDRIKIVNGGDRWFIIKFVEFQYGELSENCKPHKPVIANLKKYNLLKGYSKGINTLQYKDKEKDKDIKGGAGGNFKIQVEEIISYLNDKYDKHYSASSKANIKHIEARLNEKFTVEDFKKVIDHKSNWVGTEWDKFLRPETLFGNKFESYLNEKSTNQVNTKVREQFIPHI